MLHATILCQGNIICISTRFKFSLLHFNELDVNNNHLLLKSEYNDHSVLNILLRSTHYQVDSTTDQLDNVVLSEVVLQPTKKTKECRPTQINIEEKW